MAGEEEILKSGVHTVNSCIDSASINWLAYILSDSNLVTPDLKYGDKTANIDGTITILESKGGEPLGTFNVQVKKIIRKKTIISHSLRKKFIAYARKNFDNPPLLIVVDTEQEVAYWIEMNNLTLSQMKGKTVRLNPKNEITKGNLSYYSQWRKILSNRKIPVAFIRWKKDHQLGAYEIDFIRKYYDDLEETIKVTLGSSDAEEFKKSIFPEQSKVQENIDDTEIARVSKSFVSKIKKEYLLPLIDFAFPVFSDDRGEQKKTIISKILRISRQTEEDMIEELIAKKKLTVKENLYIISDMDEINIIQEKMIEEGIIRIEDVLTLFIGEEYE